MAIAPITGALKRRAATDVAVGFAIGTVGAVYWWWGFHKGVVDKREKFYASLAASKQAEDE